MDLTGFGVEQLAAKYGPFIAFIAFSLLTGWRREGRCEARLKALETTIQNTLVATVRKNTAALTKASTFFQRIERLLPGMLRRKPQGRKRAARRRAA